VGIAQPTSPETTLLIAARSGDKGAFAELVGPHRAGLHAHCYRMLASMEDAEDALQEALLRAWVGLAKFEGRGSIQSWLYTIASRAALDLASRRPKRVLPLDSIPTAEVHGGGVSASETTWVGPFPAEQLGLGNGLASPEARYELRESVELAFIAAAQHLAPRQRAVLLLRDVLGFSAQEAATALGMTVAAANSGLERARAAVAQRCPEPSQQSTLRSVGDARVRDLVTRYSEALERADMEGMLALLVEDASWAMPPEPQWYLGREAIAGFLADGPFQVQWRHLETRANGQIALGCYLWDASRQTFSAAVLDVLTLRGPQIAAVTAFLDGAIFPRFGLPLEVSL
jgi:RNA polymerase sigma-70 factor, ECF subfamily